MCLVPVCLVLLFSQMYECFQSSSGVTVPGYYHWGPGEGPVLYCPQRCMTSSSPERCCACNSVPCWDLPNAASICGFNKSSLYIERSNLFHSIVSNPVKADVYELVNTGGSLREFPENICDFSHSLVKLDLSQNYLRDIQVLKCLQNIDTIHLDENLIDHIDNTTFTNMSRLRVLTLRGNKLGDIGPNVLTIGDRNILTVDLSYNYLDKVDITNIIRPGPFCELSLEHSFASEITNELGHVLDDSIMHGPGHIMLEHSNITHFLNFSEVGIDLSDLSDIFSGRVWIDESSFRCDCNMYPFLSALGVEAGRFWPNLDHQSFTCNSPEWMKGQNVTTIMQSAAYDQLVCDLENCPFYGKCRCLDKPYYGRVVVNCTRAGLTEFPDEMPVGYWNNKNIELILVENYIRKIPDRNYLSRLLDLDLAGNLISETNPDAVRQIVSPINMPDQQLSELVSDFAGKDPDVIEFGTHPVSCDCKNLWVGHWIRVHGAQGRLMCRVPDGSLVPAEEVTSASLGCVTPVVPVAAVISPIVSSITIIILLTGLCFIYKYDIMIFARRFRKYKLPENESCYDVFISFCEEDTESAYFLVNNYIKSGLESAGYSLFIPWFHLTAGVDRDTEVAMEITKCQHYVVVLSYGYLDDYNCIHEFDCIWKNFKRCKSKKIIVVNLDFINSNAISDKRLHAFLRIGSELSFRDTHNTLLERLKSKLGEPASKYKDEKEPGQVKDTAVRENRNELKDIEAYFAMPVHVRLNLRIHKCNCKYRRCYVHSDLFPKVEI